MILAEIIGSLKYANSPVNEARLHFNTLLTSLLIPNKDRLQKKAHTPNIGIIVAILLCSMIGKRTKKVYRPKDKITES